MGGTICLWRYRERTLEYPGFHLSADPRGAAQLLTLLGSLGRARAPQIANVTLDPLTATALAVPKVRPQAIAGFRHWELVVDPRFAPERLHFTATPDRVRTELSLTQVESVAAGIEDVRVRRGGYAIGDEDEHQLWFWWQDDPIQPE